MSMAFLIVVLALFVLAALGAPIALAMITSSGLYLFLTGLDMALTSEKALQGLFDSFILLAVPLFIVAANIMNAGTISDRLLSFSIAMVGRFRGGMGHVNVLVSLIFSGMSGSAIADAAGVGKMMIQMMTKDGRYSPGFAAAITAASATIGPIIPPSIPMVMYSLISDTSIGFLFLGGIIPGLLMGTMLIIMIAIIARRRGMHAEEAVPLRQLPRITLTAFPALLMPAILLYGIYGGVTTPTEAAAVAAAYALILAAGFYRALSFKTLYRILASSARQSAAIGLIIAGALIFNFIIASENIPGTVSGALDDLSIPPLVFLLAVNVLLLLLGALLDATTIILVIVPLFVPAARLLGVDLVHFGVVVVVNTMIGLITPPYGVLLFVINATTGISLREMIREVLPFLAALIGALIIMVVFPDLVLWLPRVFGYRG